MHPAPDAAQVNTLRSFNRFFTRHVGVLDESLLKTRFTLTQGRVLFELATRGTATFSELKAELGLDPGYLSRILRDFTAERLISRKKSAEDARRVRLTLTAKGRKAFAGLDGRAHDKAAEVLGALPPLRRARALDSIRQVQALLSPPDPAHGSTDAGQLVVRSHRAGDVGWAIERHGQLYQEEFGWNQEMEAFIATLFARFATRHDPASERFWVAELDGERVGCVFVVRNEEDPDAAQLRCLLVDPKGRGLGVGRRLVDECIAFAKAAGYRRMVLWTNDVLVSARRIYQAAGFSLVKEERHHSFGKDLVGQVWTLEFGRSG